MHPDCTLLIEHLDRSRHALLDGVHAVPEELRTKRPGDGRWSVAEVLEHLTLVERRSNVLLRGVAQKAKAGLATPANGNLPHSLLLDRTHKRVATEAVQPSGSVAVAESLAALESARSDLRAVVSSADERLLGAHAYDHPVFGPLNFRQWVEFLAGHEARHTAQIVEIGQQLQAR